MIGIEGCVPAIWPALLDCLVLFAAEFILVALKATLVTDLILRSRSYARRATVLTPDRRVLHWVLVATHTAGSRASIVCVRQGPCSLHL